MKFLRGKYVIIPLFVLFVSCIVQVPIINFVKHESSRYMLTTYRNELKGDVLRVVESKVKTKLKEDLKGEVIQELRVEMKDSVLESLRETLSKEIRAGRMWTKYVSSQEDIKEEF